MSHWFIWGFPVARSLCYLVFLHYLIDNCYNKCLIFTFFMKKWGCNTVSFLPTTLSMTHQFGECVRSHTTHISNVVETSTFLVPTTVAFSIILADTVSIIHCSSTYNHRVLISSVESARADRNQPGFFTSDRLIGFLSRQRSRKRVLHHTDSLFRSVEACYR